jgi:TetR/AcrR family transcriptional repressor of nem operon
MAVTTRERILEAAEEIMLSKSFHSVGLREILKAVKVPKGSFYHHFSSKEQFGVELLKHYVNVHTERLNRHFRASGMTGIEKFNEYWSCQIGLITETRCRQSCLVAKLGLEVAGFSESMRAVMVQALSSWRTIYERAIREGQADGSIRKDLDPALAAAAIQDMWQGALQRTEVEKSAAPLLAAAKFLGQTLSPVI